ncbi:RDD family protein [Neisseriaceae bacterium ESL0693]|nr:RDD family protein [Neisseriaceae bacterium ESL0693]
MTQDNIPDIAEPDMALPATHENTGFCLASPWRRIAAVLINLIILSLTILPFSGAIINLLMSKAVPDPHVDSMNTIYNFYHPIIANIMTGSLLFIIVLIWQWVWMSRYGQSIGKRLLGIKVIGLDGQNPGFNGTVLVREVSFGFLVCLGFNVAFFVIYCINFVGLPLIASILAHLWVILFYCLPVICLIMLFINKIQRRTLQDLLAKTKVVYLPKH